jgi:hypothetical protein
MIDARSVIFYIRRMGMINDNALLALLDTHVTRAIEKIKHSQNADDDDNG